MRYTEEVTRLQPITKVESLEVPEALVKLVKSSDPKFGRNGYQYMGFQRERRGGTVIDRLNGYLTHHKDYHEEFGHPCDCPVKV